MPSSPSFPASWREIRDQTEGLTLVGVLQRELPVGHELAGRTARAIARRDDSDDVLFLLEDGRVAEVHLTWSGGNVSDQPAAQIFADVDIWSAATTDT